MCDWSVCPSCQLRTVADLPAPSASLDVTFTLLGPLELNVAASTLNTVPPETIYINYASYTTYIDNTLWGVGVWEEVYICRCGVGKRGM